MSIAAPISKNRKDDQKDIQFQSKQMLSSRPSSTVNGMQGGSQVHSSAGIGRSPRSSLGHTLGAWHVLVIFVGKWNSSIDGKFGMKNKNWEACICSREFLRCSVRVDTCSATTSDKRCICGCCVSGCYCRCCCCC